MPPLTNLPKFLIPKTPILTTTIRTFTTSLLRMAEGDTGALRKGGEASSDSWTRREKAAEDMYIKQREKDVMKMLKEKIAAQEAVLEKDREVLQRMEEGYGKVVEGRGT